MNLIIRNLLHVIRRFKLAASLNILGLSVAFAAFMVIMMQLKWDFGFDKFHKHSDKIFRIETASQGEYYRVDISRPLAERFFESSPHIVAGAITDLWGGATFFQIENNDFFFREGITRIAPKFTDVFSFDFVEGYENALNVPDNVIIPLSLSQKLFGSESAVGKHLIFFGGETVTIGAVYRDLPRNSIIGNDIYIAIPEDENRSRWTEWNYRTYLRVDDAANVPAILENFKINYLRDWEIDLRLTALPDMRFVTGVRQDNAPDTSKQTFMVLFAIAIAIVVIAGINFTNFSTALTPVRVKKVNTQRVFGAQKRTIRSALVFEAIAFSLLSYLLALGLVWQFQNSPLESMVDADLSLLAQQQIVFGTAFVALFVGLFAGIYPAYKMTSFAPALAMKGNFGLSPKGKKIRNTLIAIQFVASFALIIGVSFMFLQNRFMQNTPLGYDKDALITVNIGQIREHRDAFIHQLKAHSAIENVTFAEVLLSAHDAYMQWGRRYQDRTIFFQVIPVHYSFLRVMGIDITEGRDFRREDENRQQGVFVFNETARREFDLELNTSIGGVGGEIIGFMPDVKFASFRVAVEPMAFYVWGTENWGTQPNHAYIQVAQGANLREAMTHIQTTLDGFDTTFPLTARFYDEILQRTYEKERALSSLILLFSLIAIFISIVGVFGLVVFESECRRKEIGIRKVLGASSIGIVLMFNKTYFKILLICFVAAVPLAWYAVSRWLENFAYRTPMYWWIYLLAFLAVGAITVLTVTIQNWRVANDNPVKSIKTE